MQLQPNDIHVWSIDLTNRPNQDKLIHLLSADERSRAERFHQITHKQRYVIAHAHMRQILALYLPIPAQQIVFVHSEHNKPSLSPTYPISIQFNLTHSHEIAVLALTLDYAIGVDVEKIDKNYNPAIAKRYFSAKENAALEALPKHEQTNGFYRIWSRKEALTKAIGTGLFLPLSSFSVSVADITETISLQDKIWSLAPLSIHPDYASALATNQPIKTITYQQLSYTISDNQRTD